MRNRSFELSEYGNLLMYKGDYSLSDIKDIICANNLSGLQIFDFWDPLSSLNFLRRCTFLERLEITCRYDQDFSFLADMSQLIGFGLGPSYPMKNRVDLSALINARELSLQWASNEITGLEKCKNVKDLCLVEFPKDDLTVVSDLTKVSRLRIKTGRMKTLSGMKNLNELKILELGNCRRLVSVAALSGLQNLESILIESCRKIGDLSVLSALPNLRKLNFFNCGPIPDELIKNLASVTEISLGGDSY